MLLTNKRTVSNPFPEKKVAAVQSVFSVPQLVLLWGQRLVVFWSNRIQKRGVFTGKNKPIFIFAGTVSSDDGDHHQRAAFGGKTRVRRLLVSSLKRKLPKSLTENHTRGTCSSTELVVEYCLQGVFPFLFGKGTGTGLEEDFFVSSSVGWKYDCEVPPNKNHQQNIG
ncbi:MAG: hypothetical protein GF308_16075 [Candidatus Heimdallarchaeota archaeon]|nr:hypothetical protein [Candidatus Heimdallarchaeota archaeon]